MVGRVDGTGRFGNARETRSTTEIGRYTRRLDVVEITTAIVGHFVPETESSTAT